MLNYCRSDVLIFCLSGMLVGRNLLFELKDKSWIPEQAREDSKRNKSGKTIKKSNNPITVIPARLINRLSGTLLGRNSLLSAFIPAPYDSLV
ncbi:protein of unknown function [Shewanella benthica]|uniref:Uncharacterized protein n=1 Tax=Shewanella benthica TaxID=43661 RepID=A0A330M2D9_9GAMM|nr:protein of unknown function [Shewanella benthica]